MEYAFVKELPHDYLCMICAKVLNEPHLTDCCGQHFCQTCLEQWFKKQAKKICPHCRSENFTHISYIPLKRKINALEMNCPNQAEGCTMITKLGELSIHQNECGFVKVVCSRGCGRWILRKDLPRHFNSECSKRNIECKFCGKVDYFETINGEHTTVCDEYPVNCPKGCTLSGGIKRKDLARHAEICPLENVQCPFNEAGCCTRVLRKDLSAHMESNTQQHLMTMMIAYSNLKLEHTKLHSEHSKFKEDFKQISSQVASLTVVEPVKLINESDTFSFIITLSKGWTSPPFCILDGYKFCIKHKEGRAASLMLLKGKDDDNLQWPMDLQYKLEMLFEKPHKTTVQGRLTVPTPRHLHICVFPLSNYVERVAIGDHSTEIRNITLPVEDFLNYKMIVKLVPITLSPLATTAIDLMQST